MKTEKVEKLVVAVTGASGVAYAYRLLEILHEKSIPVELVVTKGGEQTLRYELGLRPSDLDKFAAQRLDPYDTAQDAASGSAKRRGMVIVPCTMNKIALIAAGVSNDAVLRIADVMLKEGRPLVVVPRETPLNENHLRNMLRLRRMGVRIVAAMPGFYHRPENLSGIIDFVVARILDQLKISHALLPAWKKPPE